MFKVIWVAGMPRSGSMWTYNVVRELTWRAGFRVLPEEVLITDQQCAAYVNREVRANTDPGTVFVLKIHSPLASVPPGNFVITNIRDIRDAAISYMRFMRVDFEKALEKFKIVVGIADHYLDLPDDQRMLLRYDDLIADPAITVSHLARRIGLSIDDQEAKSVAAAFSKENVRALIESKDQLVRDAAKTGRTPPGEILIKREDGVLASFDRPTGFQSDHVSDYQDGSWRHLLSKEQIRVLDDVFGGWLERNGYAA